MANAEYTVRLAAFEGPLDLLLFLIKRAEVEITDIPVAQIASSYLEFLRQIGEPGGIDVDEAGEFLVMAATLMEIKARMLAPPVEEAQARAPAGESDGAPREGAGEPSPDPRSELVRQLLEYKRIRDASDRLESLRRSWNDRYPTRSAGLAKATGDALDSGADASDGPEHGPIELGDLTLIDLVEAFARIVETVDMSRVGEHRVVMDDTPVEVHAEEILSMLAGRTGEPTLPMGELREGLSAGEVDFREVFAGRTRSEAIGLFLAVLELVKQQRVAVRQDSGGRIVLAGAGENANEAGGEGVATGVEHEHGAT